MMTRTIIKILIVSCVAASSSAQQDERKPGVSRKADGALIAEGGDRNSAGSSTDGDSNAPTNAPISNASQSSDVALDTDTDTSQTGVDSESEDPFFPMIVAVVGALCITFRKGIAGGTAWPAFARLSAPVLGFMGIFWGLVEGLFGNGHEFWGIATSGMVLLILIAPILSAKKGGVL
ncbi:MAG TPA: hypothetical protein PK967_19510 [Candidatus Hydrogenedentes bacterium]|nr:hypothetical protein [Candidatus Hydrogenedentota bacterium]